MMIIHVEGDILLSKANAIVHGVGMNDPMDKGLALTLHTQFPAMHKDFHHWCHQHRPNAGDVWLWGGTDGVRIVNLVIREGADAHDHRHGVATISHVNHALRALVKLVQKENFTSLALPRLGTGAGHLNWDEVLPLIENHLGQLDIPVYIYSTYRANQHANESL